MKKTGSPNGGCRSARSGASPHEAPARMLALCALKGARSMSAGSGRRIRRPLGRADSAPDEAPSEIWNRGALARRADG